MILLTKFDFSLLRARGVREKLLRRDFLVSPLKTILYNKYFKLNFFFCSNKFNKTDNGYTYIHVYYINSIVINYSSSNIIRLFRWNIYWNCRKRKTFRTSIFVSDSVFWWKLLRIVLRLLSAKLWQRYRWNVILSLPG